MREEGVPLLNITIGNPYVNPHVNRPYDDGPYPPPEHPFAGVARLCRCVSEIKRAVPGPRSWHLAVLHAGSFPEIWPPA